MNTKNKIMPRNSLLEYISKGAGLGISGSIVIECGYYCIADIAQQMCDSCEPKILQMSNLELITSATVLTGSMAIIYASLGATVWGIEYLFKKCQNNKKNYQP